MLARIAAQILGERTVGVACDFEDLLGNDGRGLDLDVREHLGAEQLSRDDATTQHTGSLAAVTGESGVLKVLGSRAERDRRPTYARSAGSRATSGPGSSSRCEPITQASVSPSCSICAWTRFIAGLPMKLATKRLTGCS